MHSSGRVKPCERFSLSLPSLLLEWIKGKEMPATHVLNRALHLAIQSTREPICDMCALNLSAMQNSVYVSPFLRIQRMVWAAETQINFFFLRMRSSFQCDACQTCKTVSNRFHIRSTHAHKKTKITTTICSFVPKSHLGWRAKRWIVVRLNAIAYLRSQKNDDRPTANEVYLFTSMYYTIIFIHKNRFSNEKANGEHEQQ